MTARTKTLTLATPLATTILLGALACAKPVTPTSGAAPTSPPAIDPHAEYAAGTECACHQHAGGSPTEELSSYGACLAHFAQCRGGDAGCADQYSILKRLLAQRRCATGGASPLLAVYEAWAPEGAHASWRTVVVASVTVGLAPEPLFDASAIDLLRERGREHGCVSTPPALSVEWGIEITPRAAVMPRIVAAAGDVPNALDDTCRNGPCLVLMKGASPLGFINAGGWDLQHPLDFSDVGLDSVCDASVP
jgi:hypothetical protein